MYIFKWFLRLRYYFQSPVLSWLNNIIYYNNMYKSRLLYYVIIYCLFYKMFFIFAGLWQIKNLENLYVSSSFALKPIDEAECHRKMCVRDSNRMLGKKNCAPTVFVRKRSTPRSPNGYLLTTNHYRKFLQPR